MTDQPTASQPAQPTGLQAGDPVKVGDFWLDARLTAGPAGIAYAAHDDEANSVMLILASDGAAADAAARDRLAGEVNRMHIDTVVARGGDGQDSGRLAHRYRAEDDDPVSDEHAPLAPWVALSYDGSQRAVDEADRVLSAIDLSMTRQLSEPAGPDYRLHWIDRTQPGPNRLWPLPWPGRADRAGWVTMLTSWLLMLLLAALAVLLAIILFQNFPPQSPPPPVPTDGSGEPQSVQPDTGLGTPTDTPSMESPEPSGTASGEGSPTPNRKL